MPTCPLCNKLFRSPVAVTRHLRDTKDIEHAAFRKANEHNLQQLKTEWTRLVRIDTVKGIRFCKELPINRKLYSTYELNKANEILKSCDQCSITKRRKCRKKMMKSSTISEEYKVRRLREINREIKQMKKWIILKQQLKNLWQQGEL